MPRAVFLLLPLFISLSLASPQAHPADGRADYDLDDDGLIEINDWADLDEVRNNLDGSSLYGSSEGCPTDGCIGFELTTDLDFDTNGDGVLDSNDSYWNGGEGWQPLGSYSDSFTSVFHGNGHRIRNLMIARRGNTGLFSRLTDASVQELVLNGPLMAIEGSGFVGGLAGSANTSQITATFVSGTVAGTDSRIGGLVGNALNTTIAASYVSGAVRGDSYVGGLVGFGRDSTVIASLSTANVWVRINTGGLIGYLGSASASHWATDVSGQATSAGGAGATLAELQCPTGADNTTCAIDSTLYIGWSNHTDTQGNPYWDFGTNTELPGLRLQGTLYRDGDGDGALGVDDEFPTLFAASRDSDGDGAIDRWTLGCDADCRAASGLVLDQFPENAAAARDTDLDGLPDQWNASCDSSCQSASGLILDDMPGDTDNDGIGNKDDEDDNNDGVADADADSDGLIEIATLAELDTVRYSLAGEGQRLSADGALDTSGCPQVLVSGVLQARCHGYELVADLDFDTSDDGTLDSSDAYWNGGEGWQPLGNYSYPFTSVFHGNGHRIRNLMIARPDSDYQGLFGALSYASVRELALSGPLMAIEGDDYVGGLAGRASQSQITAIFVSGSVVGTDNYIGGLVGVALNTTIAASYVSGRVRGDGYVGGFVGYGSGSTVAVSLSTANVSGSTDAGGLVGYLGSASASHWATDASGQASSYGGGTGASLAELQCPTGADNTTCVTDRPLYTDWSSHTDAQGNPYWDFGTNTELPGLRLQGTVHRDGDGDGDGAENADDAFPANIAASVDTDGDGRPDSWNADCDSACQSASGLTLDDDNDNDGVANAQDAFPLDVAASVDADNDRLPDTWLAACDSACQSASNLTLDTSLNDTDNDGVTNDIDDLPANAAASVDTDGDGLPDSWNDDCDSACQSASSLTLDDDNDNDGVANAEDAYPTDPTRTEDEDAPEILKAPEAISVAATGESTLVTLNVNEAQAIDNFDNELDFQVELNGELLSINDDQQVTLPSGALSLDWYAVDDAGNRSESLSQTVDVYPQVRFTLDESTTGEDREASVAVELSGPSPAYPVSILVSWVEADSTATSADVVTEGENGVNLGELLVTIDSADALENAAVRIPVVGDDLVESDEVLALELAAAMAGSGVTFPMPIDDERSSHRATITDTNVAPTVHITGSQAGENGTIFINDAGEITLTAAVEDVNGGDTHSYQWYTEELPVTPGDQASFSFDPVSMALGEYSARVVVTDDGNPMLSSEEETFTFTLQEAAAPDDGGTDDGGSDSGDQGDGDTDNGGDDDSSDGISTGGQTPVNNGGSGGGGSSGGSVGLWLLSLLALGGLWRRRLAYWRVSYWRAAH